MPLFDRKKEQPKKEKREFEINKKKFNEDEIREFLDWMYRPGSHIFWALIHEEYRARELQLREEDNKLETDTYYKGFLDAFDLIRGMTGAAKREFDIGEPEPDDDN